MGCICTRHGMAAEAARWGKKMTSLFRKFTWWMQRRRMERQNHEELQFHLSEEADERQAIGVPADQARLAARLDLGNPTIVQEDARTLWTWIALEQLGQDLRYGLRTMFKNRMFTALAALSLALGIGANTAIYSFMDSILLRSLPVSDPASLVVVKWRNKPYTFSRSREFVMRSADGSTYRDPEGITAAIFPFPAFERLQEASVYVPYAQLPPRQLRQMNLRLAHRRRPAPLRRRRPPDRARGRRASARDQHQNAGRRHRSDHQSGDRLRQTLQCFCRPRTGDRLRRALMPRWPTPWRAGPMKSACGWRWEPREDASSGWCCARCVCSSPSDWRSGCRRLSAHRGSSNRSCSTSGAERSECAGACGLCSIGRGAPGRIRTGAESVTSRSDGRPPPRVTRSQRAARSILSSSCPALQIPSAGLRAPPCARL